MKGTGGPEGGTVFFNTSARRAFMQNGRRCDAPIGRRDAHPYPSRNFIRQNGN